MSRKEISRQIKKSEPLCPKDKLYQEGDILNPTLRYGWQCAAKSWEKPTVDPSAIREWMTKPPDTEWKKRQRAGQVTGYKYSVDSQIGGSVDRHEQIEGAYPHPSKKEDTDIIDIHGMSFIKEVIPGLIEKKEQEAKEKGGPAKKVRVLDIGGGIGIYAEQIRKEFGNKVAVMTTGLAKEPVRRFRRVLADKINKVEPGTRDELYWESDGPLLDGQLSNKAHPDDLKKRSILEFRDFPEFDLIIESAAELNYQTSYNRKAGLHAWRFIESYLGAVAKKLRPGGVASISQIDALFDDNRYGLNHVDEEGLKKALERLPVEFEIVDTGRDFKYHKVLRMIKN